MPRISASERIVGDLDAALARQEIGAIRYNRVAVVAASAIVRRMCRPRSTASVSSRRRLGTRSPGGAVVFHHLAQRAPESHVLLRAMCGGWLRGEMVDWDETRLISSLRAELRQAMNIAAEPVFHKIVRWDRAIPQYHLGHLERVARIETRVKNYPGLFLAGNAYRGVSLNDCTERGSLLAEQIAAYFQAAGSVGDRSTGKTPVAYAPGSPSILALTCLLSIVFIKS